MNLEQKLKHYRISTGEYQKINELLGREPQGVEWPLFSALWSEHCSYKSSKIHLKKFFSKTDRVVEGFGENAGVIDLGHGERVAFKMESHNHPSFIEPYQGAATGVGGILRDIFTMGARPVALANYLCFGEPSAERMSFLVDGVVRGIGGYGNCVGVPTVTGQTEFHSSYNGNILVNAMAVGLFREGEKVFISKAAGPGNLVVYVGAKTGKDGVHGASMASESFDEDNESKKPNVQIGDPFYEKLLIESCIEVMSQDLVVAIQDMGAAGLTSSSFEMASKGGVGLHLNLDKVPLRDSTLTPEEILLSESQERMLLICEPQKLESLQSVFRKWDLDAEVIGEVIAEKVIRLHWHGEEIGAIDPDLLVENAPQYNREYEDWTSPRQLDEQAFQACLQEVNLDAKDVVEQSLNSIQGCSREWIYRQYDQRVGGRTVSDCEESVAMIKLPDSERDLGIVLGCRPQLMRTDARLGGYDSVLYPSLELALKGFEPLAITDCLNFGNPEKTKIMSEFVASVEAMSAACEGLQTPVISGNVSFYNETQKENVTSTPSTGVVGLREKDFRRIGSQFTEEGQQIFLLRLPLIEYSGQWAESKGVSSAFCGHFNLEQAVQFVSLVRRLSGVSGVEATRMVGKFGLSYALAKMINGDLGCELEGGTYAEKSSDWWTERLYEVLFVVNQDNSAQFAKKWSLERSSDGIDQLWRVGEVVVDQFVLGDEISCDLQKLKEVYKSGWKQNFQELA